MARSAAEEVGERVAFGVATYTSFEKTGNGKLNVSLTSGGGLWVFSRWGDPHPVIRLFSIAQLFFEATTNLSNSFL